MTSPHERIHELTGLAVLGALTSAELAEIQAHLAECEACRSEVAALTPVAAGLAQMVRQVDPPGGLRERVIGSVTGRSAVSRGQAVVTTPARAAPLLPWLLAAASFAAAVALGGYSLQLRTRMTDLERQLRQAVTQAALAQQQIADARRAALDAGSQVAVLAAPDLVRFDLAGQPVAPAAMARAFWSRSRGMVFTTSNLPSPPAGRVYQLWVLTAAGPPISVGVLEPDQTGALTAVFQTPAGIPPPTQVAVSDEPPGGVPAPTGMIWIAGKRAG